MQLPACLPPVLAILRMLWILRLSTGWNLYLTLQGCPDAACACSQQLHTAVGTAKLLMCTSAPAGPPLPRREKPGEHCVSCLQLSDSLAFQLVRSNPSPGIVCAHTCSRAHLPCELTEICSGMHKVSGVAIRVELVCGGGNADALLMVTGISHLIWQS